MLILFLVIVFEIAVFALGLLVSFVLEFAVWLCFPVAGNVSPVGGLSLYCLDFCCGGS